MVGRMLTSEYGQLMRHMEWADALVWKAVFGLPRVELDENLRERLYHIHAVQWAYLQMWRQDAIDLREESSFEDLHSLFEWGRDYHRQVAEHFSAVDTAGLRQQIQVPWAQQVAERFGNAPPATLGETILQVVYHTTYHRGQINRRLRELDGEPPLTDFIAWIWLGKPAAEW